MKKNKTTFYLKDETLKALNRLRDLEGRFISDIMDDMVFNRLAWAEKNYDTKRYYEARINDEKFRLIVKLQSELKGGEWEKRYDALLKATERSE